MVWLMHLGVRFLHQVLTSRTHVDDGFRQNLWAQALKNYSKLRVSCDQDSLGGGQNWRIEGLNV